MVARQMWWADSEVESLCGQTFNAQFTHTCSQRTGGYTQYFGSPVVAFDAPIGMF